MAQLKIVPKLYHGTCFENGKKLIENGWQPNKTNKGANQGNQKYLYLSTGIEDALWFAEEKGCSCIIELSNIPINYLIPDPEDSMEDTAEKEIERSLRTNFPAKLALTVPIGPEYFSIIQE